ncbi:formate dehydrogenase accessory protein FdhE [bacterium]|nr:formate dehydrogenase accessory protein FdhE [bacterium]
MSDIQLADPFKDLTRKCPQLGEILSFGRELLTELKQIRPAIDIEPFKPTPDLLKIKLKDGFPLLDKSRIDLPINQFIEILKGISVFFAQKRAALKPAILELVEKINNHKFDMQGLTRLILNQAACNKKETLTIDSAADERKDLNRTSNVKCLHNDDAKANYNTREKEQNPPVLLTILIWISLKPFGHSFGEALNPIFQSQQGLPPWHQSYCPVCGSSPQLAYIIGEEGQRHLICSWCDSSWAFPRIQCPCCQNIDQDTLKYFYLDDEKELKGKDRVAVCMKCKRYLKTIDLRKYEEENTRDLQMEDLSTIHLDLLAEREGYERIARSIFLF